MSSRKSGHGEQISDLPSYYSSNGTRDRSSLIRSKARSGPNRSTKASGKLKILPEEPEEAVVSKDTLQLPTSTRKSAAKNNGSDEHVRLNGANNNLSAFRSTSSRNINGGVEEHDGDDDDDDDDDDSSDDGDGDEADDQRAKLAKQLDLAKIPEGSMRRDARRITRKGRASLPRVTAYSTATSYRMRELTKWLQARRETHRTNAMTFDECVYSTYTYELVDQSRGANNHLPVHMQHSGLSSGDTLREDVPNIVPLPPSKERVGDLLGIPELQEPTDEQSTANLNARLVAERVPADDDVNRGEDVRLQRREEARRRRRERFIVHGMVPEVFFMEYGTVVIWGMSVAEEKRLLREVRRFEVEKLAAEDVESEDLNWYLADYSRIYNDVITLRKGSSYMTKLSLSHALAQSTKISFFEGVIDNTIDTTKDIPQSIAESGKIGLPPIDIMKQIGHLFILRMNIHLVGSIVDSPEIFWAQPDLEPLYSAARSYLEIPQRIELLNARVDVLQDMLQLLKDQVTSSHSEWLEIIVIVLILLEIILGVATMVVDLYFA